MHEGEARLKQSPAIQHWPADRERREAASLLSFVLGLLVGVVFHYALYRMGLPLEPFIYVAF